VRQECLIRGSICSLRRIIDAVFMGIEDNLVQIENREKLRYRAVSGDPLTDISVNKVCCFFVYEKRVNI